MDNMILETTLREGLSEMGLPFGPEILRAFCRYAELLADRSAVMNLTAITGEGETARLHFLDSVAPLQSLDFSHATVIDIGSGAGFPGIPLRLLCHEMRLTLLDSQGKRVAFLREVCDTLDLSDVRCVQARAEELSEMREQFDYAVSRAVAKLNLLLELCLPYVTPGGAFLALKGPAVAEELSQSEKAISLLGGKLERIWEYKIPGAPVQHKLVVIRKVAHTPEKYPRRFSLMKKSPL